MAQTSPEHALDDEVSGPLGNLAYDENLNEVVDIGSDVEEIEGMDGTTASTLCSELVEDQNAGARLKASSEKKPSQTLRSRLSAKRSRYAFSKTSRTSKTSKGRKSRMSTRRHHNKSKAQK
ncbi:hypothetical protein COOONC_15853 [Cooperia oncophora]